MSPLNPPGFHAMHNNGSDWIPVNERDSMLLKACLHYQEHMLAHPESTRIHDAVTLETIIADLEKRNK